MKTWEMCLYWFTVYFILVMFCAQEVVAKSLRLASFEQCDKKLPIKFFTTIEDRNDIQYISGNLTLPFTLDKSFMLFAKPSLVMGSKKVALFEIKTPICDFLTKILGKFAQGLEKALGLPYACPFPKGLYQMKNKELDLKSMTVVETLPKGQVVADAKIENSKKQTVWCVTVKVEIE